MKMTFPERLAIILDNEYENERYGGVEEIQMRDMTSTMIGGLGTRLVFSLTALCSRSRILPMR